MASRSGSPTNTSYTTRHPRRPAEACAVLVFRKRQAIKDLAATILHARQSLERFALPEVAKLVSQLNEGHGFQVSRDREMHTNVLLAAALPDEDFQSFTTATAILLIDLLENGHSTDDLFWNWEAYQAHYRFADSPVRAAIMNGFRTAEELAIMSPENGPTEQDCLTNSETDVAKSMQASRYDGLAKMTNISAQQAGILWAEYDRALDANSLTFFRYIYERPASMAPPSPEDTKLIPWTV